jgi:uncharacterized phage-associated protein
MKTYDSPLLGKYLVSLANSKLKPLNMTKLQKLMFIIYGYYLSKGHRIVSEYPQAWPFGPVFPMIHKRVDYTQVTPLDDPIFDEIRADKELVGFLARVVDLYTTFSATQLSNWSHMDGSPWEKTTRTEGFKWSKEIPDEFIANHFSQIQVV